MLLFSLFHIQVDEEPWWCSPDLWLLAGLLIVRLVGWFISWLIGGLVGLDQFFVTHSGGSLLVEAPSSSSSSLSSSPLYCDSQAFVSSSPSSPSFSSPPPHSLLQHFLLSALWMQINSWSSLTAGVSAQTAAAEEGEPPWSSSPVRQIKKRHQVLPAHLVTSCRTVSGYRNSVGGACSTELTEH